MFVQVALAAVAVDYKVVDRKATKKEIEESCMHSRLINVVIYYIYIGGIYN